MKGGELEFTVMAQQVQNENDMHRSEREHLHSNYGV